MVNDGRVSAGGVVGGGNGGLQKRLLSSASQPVYQSADFLGAKSLANRAKVLYECRENFQFTADLPQRLEGGPSPSTLLGRRLLTTRHYSAAMQTIAAAAGRSPDRLLARLSGELAALLGEVDVSETDMVGKLRAGLSGVLAREARPAVHADVALAAMGLATRPEAEVVDWLRERGLITYPAPLLDLLQTDIFEEVLERLDPTARTMLAQVGKPWLAAVLASGLPRLPQGVMVRLRLRDFCTSAERLAWAKANGCPWWDGAT